MNRLDTVIERLESVRAQLSSVNGGESDQFSLNFCYFTVQRVIEDLRLMRR